MDVSPDGSHLVTGASDGTVHVFKRAGSLNGAAADLDLIGRVTEGPVWWVAFDHALDAVLRVAIDGADGTARIWNVGKLDALFSDPKTLEHQAQTQGGLLIRGDDPAEVTALPPGPSAAAP